MIHVKATAVIPTHLTRINPIEVAAGEVDLRHFSPNAGYDHARRILPPTHARRCRRQHVKPNRDVVLHLEKYGSIANKGP